MTNRELPHSLRAERAALGAVLTSPAALDELAELRTDDFFLPAHRDVLDAMRALMARGRAVEVLTVIDELKARGVLPRLDGGDAYLLALANEADRPWNLGHWVEIIAQKATLRRLIATCAEVQAAAFGDVGDVGEMLAEVRQKVADIEAAGTGQGPTPLRDDLADVLDSIEHRAKDPDAYFLTTGIRRYDENVGGLRGGQLIVIATRPGMGKSALVLDVVLHNAAKSIPALLFSMEMTRSEVIERAIAKVGNVNGRNVATGRLALNEWADVQRAAGKLHDLPVWIDQRGLSAQRICSEARRWRARHEGRVLVAIDYLGLVSSTGDERNRAIEVGRMTRMFKLLAAEIDAPVLLLAQLNREVTKAQREPVPSDLRDSGSIEQDANTIIFPWWEGTPPREGRHPAHLIVGKNRGGPVGKVPVDWEPAFMRFVDREFDDMDAEGTL